MSTEKARALVLRTTDWSETSRIATLWTREFGKVRVLAKGGRRLRSSFDNALDLLTLCSIVLIRKSSGGLDLLTEAQVAQRFGKLGTHLPALYGAYYVAELLSDGTQENDAHPALFDLAVRTLEELDRSAACHGPAGGTLLRFEAQLFVELGYRPVLDQCVRCGESGYLQDDAGWAAFSVAAGGLVCRMCQPLQQDRLALSAAALEALRALTDEGERWRALVVVTGVETELRRLLGQYVTWLWGRRPRLLAYLEALPRGTR